MVSPTPTETARAAELAPRVAEITGLEYHKSAWSDFGPPWGAFVSENPDPAKPELVFTHALDPRAFQAVLLALPDKTVETILRRMKAGLQRGNLPSDYGGPLIKWLHTPPGYLAFYKYLIDISNEALVAQADQRTCAGCGVRVEDSDNLCGSCFEDNHDH